MNKKDTGYFLLFNKYGEFVGGCTSRTEAKRKSNSFIEVNKRKYLESFWERFRIYKERKLKYIEYKYDLEYRWYRFKKELPEKLLVLLLSILLLAILVLFFTLIQDIIKFSAENVAGLPYNIR